MGAPILTEYRVFAPVPRDLTLLFASDLHCCDPAPVLRLIDSVPDADAVLIGGDLVHNERDYARGFEFLSECGRRMPTFLAVGNHERQYGGGLAPVCERAGATFLDNDCAAFRGVLIGGLSSGFPEHYGAYGFPSTPVPDLGFLSRFAGREGYKILLSHHPEYYPKYIAALDVDLTLSGHAHGGQWRAFGRGVFAPGQGLFPKYTSGVHDGRLIVGRGLGNPHPVPRIFNRPELIVLRLQKEV